MVLNHEQGNLSEMFRFFSEMVWNHKMFTMKWNLEFFMCKHFDFV